MQYYCYLSITVPVLDYSLEITVEWMAPLIRSSPVIRPAYGPSQHGDADMVKDVFIQYIGIFSRVLISYIIDM